MIKTLRKRYAVVSTVECFIMHDSTGSGVSLSAWQSMKFQVKFQVCVPCSK